MLKITQCIIVCPV